MIDSICNKLMSITNCEELHRLRNEGAFYLIPSGERPIYHYTAPDTFIKIIGNKKMRFTRSDCLNDYSEGKYILSVFERVLNEMRCEYCKQDLDKSNEYTDFFKFYDEVFLRNDISAFLYDERLHDNEVITYDSFVCCFSEEKDSLPMWNYYLKNGNYEGYNIGFHSPSMFDAKNIQWLKVIYTIKEQAKLIRCMIDSIYKIYSNFDPYIMRLIMTDWKLMFKNIAFSHEKEVRVVLKIPRNKHPDNVNKVEYMSRRGLITPYIDYEFVPESILDVTIGPMAYNMCAIHSTIQFLEAKNILKNRNGFYADEMVNVSTIPVRF